MVTNGSITKGMKNMYERNYQQDDIAANPLAMFLLGAAIGAVAALLYAPKSGRETRALIAD